MIIATLTDSDLPALQAHVARHRAESGVGDNLHFMPFVPGDEEGPQGIDTKALKLSLQQPGWQRWFLAKPDADTVVGQVDLKGDKLKTGLHRCELGIGIEQGWRGQGLGEKLMLAAIEFARLESSISWIDLRVFAHNAPARALYERLGFEIVGTLEDRFRIDGESIGDVIM